MKTQTDTVPSTHAAEGNNIVPKEVAYKTVDRYPVTYNSLTYGFRIIGSQCPPISIPDSVFCRAILALLSQQYTRLKGTKVFARIMLLHSKKVLHEVFWHKQE